MENKVIKLIDNMIVKLEYKKEAILEHGWTKLLSWNRIHNL